ncbi:hypothetical protein QUB37_08600 [Microcoleus sp. AT3-A2]|uniref:hypothetical protein n=1 Tax=unclassified Microcoleus TaxID=2642155 RepID=UPI002FD489C4
MRHSPFTGEFLTGISVAAGKFPPPPHTFDQHGADTINKFDQTKLPTKFVNTSEGWLVQVYNSADRSLLCVLDSSHAWTFLLGCAFGLLLAVGWFNLASYSPSRTYEPSTTPPEMWID